MDIIKFDSLLWLKVFNQKLKKDYKKMFFPNGDSFNQLWQMYVDNYCKIRDLNINIPDEIEFPVCFDYYLDNNNYNNYAQFHREKYIEFCSKMRQVINLIDDYIKEKEMNV